MLRAAETRQATTVMTGMNTSPPELDGLPRIPRGPDDDLVFRSPWEAKAFALVVSMHRANT